MKHVRYPIGIDGIWHQPQAITVPDAHLKNWLMDTGSLTERLQSVCRQFEVDVLGHEVCAITAEEHETLYGKSDKNRQTQVREVLLKGDGAAWVFARSLMPQAFIDECMSDLGTLGNQPLGKILFNDPRFQRLGFELIQCSVNHSLFQDLNIQPQHGIWGRRSLFAFQSHSVMVCELFLPHSPAYRDLEIHHAN